jgi:hypothetical protein
VTKAINLKKAFGSATKRHKRRKGIEGTPLWLANNSFTHEVKPSRNKSAAFPLCFAPLVPFCGNSPAGFSIKDMGVDPGKFSGSGSDAQVVCSKFGILRLLKTAMRPNLQTQPTTQLPQTAIQNPEVFANEEVRMKREKLQRLHNMAGSINYRLVPNQ